MRRRADADQVVPGLWVGGAPDHAAARQLARRGIDAVVDLRAEAGEEESPWPAGTALRRVALIDHGAPTVAELRDAAQAVVELMREGRQVLVHCHAGQQRAPAVATAALMLTGWTLPDAYAAVSRARPQSLPTDGQLDALRNLARV